MVFSLEKFLKFFHFHPAPKEEYPITCESCKNLFYYNDGSVDCRYGFSFSRACMQNNFAFKEQERQF